MTDRSSERIYFEDPPCITMISETSPKAKRAYACAVCHKPILAGERHSKFVYLDDDTLDPAARFRCDRVHFFCGG